LRIVRLLFGLSIWIAGALILYLLLSFALLWSTSGDYSPPENNRTSETLWLYHDLAHTEIILPRGRLTPPLQELLRPYIPASSAYIAFSYGDSDFMLHTPHWRDISAVRTLKALFLDTPGAIRVGCYPAIRHDTSVIPIRITPEQMQRLQSAIARSFTQKNHRILKIEAKSPPWFCYFRAGHPYNLFYTCNQWSAGILRSTDLPAPLWAPFSWDVTAPFTK